MNVRSRAIFVFISALAMACLLASAEAFAQRRISFKSGESIELQPVYWVVNCRSTVIGSPEVEILEGPPEVTLAIKEGKVLPRRQNCADQVPGGVLIATASDISEPKEANLTYRIKFKTKDGDRQETIVYKVSLFP